MLFIVDTVVSSVQATVDTTKNAASSALEMSTSAIGSAKGILIELWKYYSLASPLFTRYFWLIVDSVANSVQATVDTTKNVAASAVEKGSSLIGCAKGRNFNLISFQFLILVLFC